MRVLIGSWEIVDTLTVEQFLRESPYSLGSLRNQLAHCINVDNRWLARLQEQSPPGSLEFEDFPDQAALRAKWDTVRPAVTDYVRGLNPRELEETVELHFPKRGGAFRNSRWQILLHMVNHGTDHRAQILALLHELGAPTFEQDLILHLWAQTQE